MKNGMKKVLSVALTLVTLAATSVAASAAGYPDEAVPTAPSVSSRPVGMPAATTAAASEQAVSAPKAEITNAVTEILSSAADTEDAVASVAVKATTSLPVSASAIKSLAKAKTGTLEFVAPKATLSIEASTIKKATKVDLSSKVYSTAKKAVIDFRSDKAFGCEVKVAFTDCKMSKARLKNAKVYCDGELVDIEIEFNEDGDPVIAITKGGKWEIK